MTNDRFPALDAGAIASTRDALHAYARVAGAWAASNRSKRKHWWHASLRPSLYGLTTGVIHGPADFELEVDFVESRMNVRTRAKPASVPLDGQSSCDLAGRVREVLADAGVDDNNVPGDDKLSDSSYSAYSADQAQRLHRAFSSVAAALADLRAGMHEETGPIQVWPHHFDLSMIWLPGSRIEGEDPNDEESSDRQMNFGFVFGDESISEPYFYITAYPTPAAMPELPLPKGASWRSDGFNGAVALYKDVAAMQDPRDYLLELWNVLLEAGREQLSGEE